MRNFTFLETPTTRKWLQMNEGLQEPEGIRERLTIDYLSENIRKKHPEVRVESIEIHDGGRYVDGEFSVEDIPHYAYVIMYKPVGGGREARIKVFLPLIWNERFLALTGGGTSCENILGMFIDTSFFNTMIDQVTALMNHFACAITSGSVDYSGQWGFIEGTNELDWNQILNWSHLSTHDMAVIAKDVCEIVYGKRPEYSYISGASAGGRQSMQMAQLYPKDFDGVVATHAAVPWVPLHISEGWGYFVLNNEGVKIPRIKFEEIKKAALAKYGCTEKGYVDNEYLPEFDPMTLVGVDTPAGPITQREAEIFTKICKGPVYSNGEKMPECEPFSPAITTWRGDIIRGQMTMEEDGTLLQGMLFVVRQVMSWVMRKPDLQLSDITYEMLDEIYDRGCAEFGFADAQRVDMRAFKNNGGKIIYCFPSGDANVPPTTAMKYYKELVRYWGEEELNEFFRFFATYGGAHTIVAADCPGEQTAISSNFVGIMHWVEDGIAPEELTKITFDNETNGPKFVGTVKRFTLNQ